MLSYYMPFFDGFNYFSVDNVRLDLDFLSSDQCQWFLNQVNKLDGFVYYSSFKDFGYRHLFTFGTKGFSFTLGVSFNGQKSLDAVKGFLDFNPNKILGDVVFGDGFIKAVNNPFGDNDDMCIREYSVTIQNVFKEVLRLLRLSTLHMHVKRWDLACDVPVTRSDVQLFKDRRKYAQFYMSQEDYTEYLPENFWFYHNGVTVFYYGKANIDFSGTTIKLNPQEISVINGAQTITNFFEGMKEIEEDIENIKEGDFTEEKNSINKLKKYSVNYIEEVLKRTKVKVIFIDGEEDFLKPITYGLNTQIPIVESDIIADSKDVNELNEKLKRKSMKICKSGEEESIHTAFSLLDFVKKYLITQFKPGTSKNLQKKDLLKYIKEANEKIDKNTDIIDEIEKVVVIEEWWKSEKKERESFYGDAIDEPYLKYGKNYFESFILISNKEPLDDDSLILAFGEFLKIFRNMERNVSDKTFKQDSLFEKYQENFITKCFEKAETIVRDLEKLPGLSKIKFGGKDINIIKLELFEYEKDEKIRRMKEYIYKIVQDMEEKPEEMTKEVLNEKLSSKMLVGQIINIDKAYVKLYKIEDVQEHSTYKRWEEDLGSDGQVNAIYFMFAVCIISYISMLTRKDGSSKCKKVIIVDNPFGATSAVFLWKVMFEILKENNVQLIAPGHNISKEIISMFEVNYVLKHEFKDGNKKTVVVEQEFRTEDSLKNMNFDTIDGNQQKLF